MKTNVVHHSLAIDTMSRVPDGSIDLIYTDPPFGTNAEQISNRLGCGSHSYKDPCDNYVQFIREHVEHFHRVLSDCGTVYVHLDYRWVHYAKVEFDKVFGRDNFLGEIIWSYNYGGRGKDFFVKKHDNILVYEKCKGCHVFNYDEVDRIPYKAPAMQYVGRSKEDADRRIVLGQIPTDVWEIPIIGTASRERVGYPSQKPMSLIRRIVVASSPREGVVLDPFCGSGTTAIVAASTGRQFIVGDKNVDAVTVTCERLTKSMVKFDTVRGTDDAFDDDKRA